jgi:hypothetical protein
LIDTPAPLRANALQQQTESTASNSTVMKNHEAIFKQKRNNFSGRKIVLTPVSLYINGAINQPREPP